MYKFFKVSQLEHLLAGLVDFLWRGVLGASPGVQLPARRFPGEVYKFCRSTLEQQWCLTLESLPHLRVLFCRSEERGAGCFLLIGPSVSHG